MKHQFKPFDKVLVRLSDKDNWNVSLYGFAWDNVNCHKSIRGVGNLSHICVGGAMYRQCIPYNEDTAYLIGTSEPYQAPKPKKWHVINKSGNFDKVLTDEEFTNFIKTAVINNRDITKFMVSYINPND